MKFKFFAGCLAILMLSAVGLSQEAQAPRVGTYTLTIIEPLPGHTHTFLPASTSVNEASRAAGYSWHMSSPPLPFEQALTAVPYVWKDGVQTPLALLEGWPGAYGFGMNNRGDVIGTAQRVGPNPATGAAMVYQTPVLWVHPRMMPMNLGVLGDGVSAFVSGINSSTQVVGYAHGGPSGPHPFIWDKGKLRELSYPDVYPGSVGMGQAYAVNDKGEIAGVTGLPNPGPFEATLWDNRGRASHLGTLGGEAPNSFAYAINNRSQVVGASWDKPPVVGGLVRPFLWENGEMRDLGTLGGPQGAAWAINNSGQIVGVARTPDNIQHAFVWEDGQMFDLNELVTLPPGIVLVAGYHVNNQGVISGIAYLLPGNIPRGFLLTPER
jgi:probable HAF family extracellular repeat protein